MKKRLLAAMMAGTMLLSACGSGTAPTSAQGGSSAAGIPGDDTIQTTGTALVEAPVKLVVAFRTFGTTPADLSKVQEALNQITREKINVETELMVIPSGSYKQQMTLMLSGDEQLDVMGAPSSLIPQAYASEQIKPLDDLMEQYGQGIKEVLGDQLLGCGYFAGELYCIPIKADIPNGMGGFMLRQDICDKYGIDAAAIDSYEKLTEYFQKVHDEEPEMVILAPYSVGYSFMQFCCQWDKLGNYFGVLGGDMQELKVVNLFETEEYKNYLNVMHDWYQRGFISKDVTNATEAGAALMKAGNLFAYTQATKPGIEIQERNSSGYEVAACQVLPTITVTNNNWQWTIPENSKNPEKAMEFLNLMYTDPDVVNLLAYGIEGDHYVQQADGTIGFPVGVDSSNSGYNMGSMVWSFGNEFNAYVWTGNEPDVWEQTKAWNESGKMSKAFGFVFNNTTVANEIAAVQNVYDQYRMSLECGVLDPAVALSEMNLKLYDAGLQKIIDEKQAQLDEWAQE